MVLAEIFNKYKKDCKIIAKGMVDKYVDKIELYNSKISIIYKKMNVNVIYLYK